MNEKIYLQDPYCREFEASVVDTTGVACTLTRTAFYPGGGGQPPDRGRIFVGDEVLEVSALREDEAGRIWHSITRDLPAGKSVRGEVDWLFRYALMRAHGLMHVVNTVAMQRFGGIITGVQLGVDRSRIDFKLSAFAREQVAEMESRVNGVIDRDLAITSLVITEEEFRRRPELIRTLNVPPPIVDGRVRIVEIKDFDAQACGATHVHTTREIGRARVGKFDNKGKDNKRFYWELEDPTSG
jgi:misacylated tRNA(Ala) deacylase